MESQRHSRSRSRSTRSGAHRRRRRRSRLLSAPKRGFARDALEVGRTRTFKSLVRAGFLARGITYGVVGGLTAAIAFGAGSGSGTPNQEGALDVIASAPLGRVLLVVVAAGLMAYALWKLTRGVFGVGPEGGGGAGLLDRLGDFSGGIVYIGFGLVAIRVLTGTASSPSSEQRKAAAGVLGLPGGAWVVGAAGVGLIAVSGYQVFAAIRGDFKQDNYTGAMGTDKRHVFVLLGRVGLTARALVFALVGYFLLRTAINYKASGIGLDGALGELHQSPFGAWLLGLAAVGLLIFAAFSIFEARYQQL